MLGDKADCSLLLALGKAIEITAEPIEKFSINRFCGRHDLRDSLLLSRHEVRSALGELALQLLGHKRFVGQ